MVHARFMLLLLLLLPAGAAAGTLLPIPYAAAKPHMHAGRGGPRLLTRLGGCGDLRHFPTAAVVLPYRTAFLVWVVLLLVHASQAAEREGSDGFAQ